MKTNYIKYGLNLSDNQKQNIAHGYKNKTSLVLKISNKDLVGKDELFLTQQQINKIQKHKNNGTGCQIKLSKSQIFKTNTIIGGFLPAALIPILALAGKAALGAMASTGAAMLTKKAIDKISGSGIPKQTTKTTNKKLLTKPHIHETQAYMTNDFDDFQTILDTLEKNHLIPNITKKDAIEHAKQQSGGSLNATNGILMSIISSLLPSLSDTLRVKGGDLFLKNQKVGGELYLKSQHPKK